MDNYAGIFKTEQKFGYSVNSGTVAVVDSNLRMVLNNLGMYEPERIDPTIEHSEYDEQLSFVSAMSDESPEESEIAKGLFGTHPGIQHDPILGYYLGLYAGYVKEEDYREQGSSGGITTWLLVQLLKEGKIDGVIHLKESEDGDGVLFKYAISRTAREIRDGSKSRYYPGEFSKAIQAAREYGGTYAITGIPSFITEVQLLKRLDHEFAQMIPYTFGLICGHQKTTKYAEALAWEYGIKPGDIRKIDFRKKDPSKPASQYLTEIQGLVNGEPTTLDIRQNQFFVSHWGHGFFKPRLSDYTDDAFNETADISLGDAWLQQYVNDSQGTNVLIVRNPDLAQIIENGISDGSINIDNLDAKTVLDSQRGLVHHTKDEIGYRLQKQDRRNAWRPKKRFEASTNIPYLRRRIQDIRESIATKSHQAYHEAVNRNDWEYFIQEMTPLVLRHGRLYKLDKLIGNSPKQFIQKASRKIRKRLRGR